MTQRILIALGCVALLSALAWWFQTAWLAPATSVASPVGTTTGVGGPPTSEPKIVVLETGLAAEVDTGAGFRPLKSGEALSADSVIRTTSGVVVLALGDDIRVEVTEDSQFRLGELTTNLSRAKLEGGRVEARVHGDEGTKFAIEVMGSDAVAEASDSDFAVLRGTDAQVTVAARRGQLSLEAAGQKVSLKQGEQSIVERAKPPSIPAQIPGSLFLKLTSKHYGRQREGELALEGVTAPGAVVSVGGTRVSAPDGHFRATVSLQEGHNDVQLVARDALGRTVVHEGTKVFVDSRAPELKGRVVW